MKIELTEQELGKIIKNIKSEIAYEIEVYILQMEESVKEPGCYTVEMDDMVRYFKTYTPSLNTLTKPL